MTKDKILEAALVLYAEHGYKGTTMKKIADVVGIKPASLYFFFENKDQLLQIVFQNILEKHQNEIQKILTSTKNSSFLESIQQLIIGLAQYHRNDVVGTKSYIQLITSDIESFKSDFSSYTVNFIDLLLAYFEQPLKKTYPAATTEVARNFFEQIVLIADGMFWSTIVYSNEAFEQRIQACSQTIQLLINQLEMKG